MTQHNRPRIGLITYSALSGLDEGDRLLQSALERRGLEVSPVVWDDSGVDWSLFDMCVVRSTWDYHHRLEEFLEWAEQAAGLTSLWNPLEVLRWNSHKLYLRELTERGVPVVPTLWLERGEAADLATLMESHGWPAAVIKPSVSASAFETVLVEQGSVERGQTHLNYLLAERDVMVQPFITSVETYRERSLLFIGGELTHAVIRQPQLRSGISPGIADTNPEQAADQDHALVTPSPEEVSLANEIVAMIDPRLLYARVDLVRGDSGEPLLLELELVEPSLFLHLAPHAVERMADAIIDRLAR